MKKVIIKSLEELNITILNDDSASVVGTSLAGKIDVSYSNLVKLFGAPNSTGDEYKIDAEWEFKMNGKVMTIYNYKTGKNYNGKSGLATSRIRNWHVGAEDDMDVTEEIKILAAELQGTVY